ncbi:hypothetical protein D3C71_2118840 [compost metagenome]
MAGWTISLMMAATIACCQFSLSLNSLSAPPMPNNAAGTTAWLIMVKKASAGSMRVRPEK